MKKHLIVIFVAALVLSAAGYYLLSAEQVLVNKNRTYSIGIVGGFKFFKATEDGFRDKMSKLGYIEGKDVTYSIHDVSGVDDAAMTSTINQLLDEKVDLIYVYPTETTVIAKKVTMGKGVPVVFSMAVIEGADLVESVRNPGGNMTGVRYIGPDFVLKRFEIMHQIAPQAKRLLVAHQENYPSAPAQLEYLRSATKEAGMSVVDISVKNANDLEAKLQAMVNGDDPGADAILTIMDPIGITPDTFKALAKFAKTHNLPIGGAYMNVDGYRSMFGLSGDIYHSGEQVAEMVDKILRGMPAGTIPVASIESYLQIDYKAITEAGLTVDAGLLSQANKVIRD